MSISVQFARIMESRRTALNGRIELCEISKRSFHLWVTTLNRQGLSEVAELVEKAWIEYIEQELISLKYLMGVVDEMQVKFSEVIMKWETENGERENE
jgi:predicted DNA-binding transcriptional regulator